MKPSFFRCISLCTLFFFAPVCLAEIYKWTDENGKVHYSDEKPKSQPTEAVDITINTYESISFDTVENSNDDRVIMYSTSWCGYCKKAKRYFRKKGIAFTEYDIEKNRVAKREYDRIGGRGVPVILVGTKRMNGFSEDGFKRIYQK